MRRLFTAALLAAAPLAYGQEVIVSGLPSKPPVIRRNNTTDLYMEFRLFGNNLPSCAVPAADGSYAVSAYGRLLDNENRWDAAAGEDAVRSITSAMATRSEMLVKGAVSRQ